MVLLFGTRVNFPVSKSTFKIQKGSWIHPATPAQIVLATQKGGGPRIVSSKVRILALRLSTWPSAYDATPCHEWRSTWGPCFSETFCTSLQHSQELSSNVSTQPIHTHHFGLFKAVVHHHINLFSLFVASPPLSYALKFAGVCTTVKSSWSKSGFSRSGAWRHGEPAYTCIFWTMIELKELGGVRTWSASIRSLTEIDIIQF